MFSIGGLFDLTGIRMPPADRLDAMCAVLIRACGPGGGSACGREAGPGGAVLQAGPAAMDADTCRRSLAVAGGIAVVLGGRIYNRERLAGRLSLDGAHLRAQSDAGLVLRLWEAGGLKALSAIEGEFAAAVWDSPAGQLVLIADAFRSRPLFWTERDGWLIFASEVLAVLDGLAAPGDVEWPAVRAFLRWGCVPGGAPPLRNIRTLRQGTALLFERGRREPAEAGVFPLPLGADTGRHDAGDSGAGADGGMDAKGYAGGAEPGWRDRTDAAGRSRSRRGGPVLPDELRACLETAVAVRLQGDRPPGIWLSGGVDSGLLAVLAGRLAGAGLDAFTLGVVGPGYDERPLARLSARAAGVRLHEFEFRIASLGDLLTAFEAFDVPLADTSIHTTFALARATSASQGTVLSGEGSDELFGGYHEYRLERLADLLPRWALRAAGTVARAAALTLRSGDDRFSAGDVLRRFASGAADTDSPRAWRWRAVLDEADIARVFLPGGLGNGGGPLFRREGDPDETDLHTILPDMLLPKADRAGKACGVEVRLPYLAPEVVALARRAGFSTGKRLLKAACEGLLPPEVVRGRKRGFSAPVRAWLRGSEAVSYT
ncbi:MAG: asparagine synthetase B, partial [Planctomycetota bacterium]|nr:asparagine synthetase B [Planctomycetota bacterium]